VVHRTRRLLLTASTAVAATALAACSSSSTPSPSGAAGAVTSAAGGAAGAATSAAGTATSAAGAATSAAAPAGADPGCPEAKGKTVAYSEPIPDPNFTNIEKIIRTELDRYGVTFKTANANLNPGKQLSDIRTLLQSGIDVLVVNPLAPQAIRPALDEARAKRVPIVAQESMEGGPFLTNITVDVESAIKEATAQIKADGKGAKVGAVTGPPLAEILVRENTAFDKQAAANGLTVVEKQANMMISPQGAKAIADSYKQKYGKELTAIWTFNDTSATGIASSLGGDFAPELFSINGQPEAIPFVKDGRITATWDLRQDKIGQALAYGALAGLCGKTIPKELVIPVTKIDKSNVDTYRPLSARVGDPFDVQLEDKDGRSYLKVGS